MLKIYDFLFCRQYKVIASVNKFYPETSAIIYFSILVNINVMSILDLFKISFEKIGLNLMYSIYFLIVAVNFWRYGKKYKTYVAEFEKTEVSKIWSYLALLYPYISFFIFFKVLDIEYLTIGIFLAIMLIVDFIIYLYSDEEKLKKS